MQNLPYVRHRQRRSCLRVTSAEPHLTTDASGARALARLGKLASVALKLAVVGQSALRPISRQGHGLSISRAGIFAYRVRGRALRNPAKPCPYSSFTPAALITLFQRSTSSRR